MAANAKTIVDAIDKSESAVWFLYVTALVLDWFGSDVWRGVRKAVERNEKSVAHHQD